MLQRIEYFQSQTTNIRAHTHTYPSPPSLVHLSAGTIKDRLIASTLTFQQMVKPCVVNSRLSFESLSKRPFPFSRYP